MHQPYLQKSNFLRKSHHSIPIGLCAGVVALLLGLMSVNKVGAVACSMLPDMPSGYTVKEINGVCETVPILTTPTEHAVPTVSLSIDNNGTAVYDKVVAEYGKVNYSEHTIKLSAKDITNYTMTLSEVKMSGPEALAGAEGVKGTELVDNSWGYGWGNVETANEELSYGSAVSKGLAGDDVSEGGVDFSRKLVFATKFNGEATAGTYKASANLSVVATPASVMYVPWEDLVYMQDMTTEVCDSVAIGTETILTDIRDNNTYTVAKLADGKCWMTQNLRITGDSIKAGLNKTITEYDSNVSVNFTVPSSEAWTDTSVTGNHVYYGNKVLYGAYYTWYTATAGTEGIGYDVCPKEWRLPVGGAEGDLKLLADKGTVKVGTWESNSETFGYWLGVEAENEVGGAFFPAAGYFKANDGALKSVGLSGNYWTSTLNGSRVYNLYFNNTMIDAESGEQYRYGGYTIRCVVK